MMRTEKQDALEFLEEVKHRKDYIAFVKEYDKEEDAQSHIIKRIIQVLLRHGL
jgi:hypothetical protein